MTEKRDQEVAGRIAAAQSTVETLRREVNAMYDHAMGFDAPGHAALYAAVSESLRGAWDALDKAWEVMANGNPEEYE